MSCVDGYREYGDYKCRTCGKDFPNHDVEKCKECKDLSAQALKDFKHEEYFKYKGEYHES